MRRLSRSARWIACRSRPYALPAADATLTVYMLTINTSTVTSAQRALRRYQQALRDMAADDLADLYAPHAVHELPFQLPGMPARLHGREQVRATYRAAWAATDARVREVRDIAVHATGDPEVVIAEQVVSGVLASTGTPFAFPGVLVIRVSDQLITHVRDYMDTFAVMRAARPRALPDTERPTRDTP